MYKQSNWCKILGLLFGKFSHRGFPGFCRIDRIPCSNSFVFRAFLQMVTISLHYSLCSSVLFLQRTVPQCLGLRAFATGRPAAILAFDLSSVLLQGDSPAFLALTLASSVLFKDAPRRNPCILASSRRSHFFPWFSFFHHD
jgi:hypothetical protein